MIKDIPGKIYRFLKAVVSELRLVEFPSRKATFRAGNTVILVSFVMGICLYFLDWFFQILRNALTSIKF
jgi:preprotein translocase SecE subunit